MQCTLQYPGYLSVGVKAESHMTLFADEFHSNLMAECSCCLFFKFLFIKCQFEFLYYVRDSVPAPPTPWLSSTKMVLNFETALMKATGHQGPFLTLIASISIPTLVCILFPYISGPWRFFWLAYFLLLLTLFSVMA